MLKKEKITYNLCTIYLSSYNSVLEKEVFIKLLI